MTGSNASGTTASDCRMLTGTSIGLRPLASDSRFLSVRPSRAVLAEELRFCENRVPEFLEEYTLVRRVNVAESVRGAEEEDLGVGHRRVKRVHEGNRSTRRNRDRVCAPAFRERGAGGVVGDARLARRETVPCRAGCDLERNSERAEAPEMTDERLARLFGVLLRMHSQVELGTCGRNDRVDRVVD